jgi:UDP-N-acetylglucosamine 2-epimerase
LLLFADNRAVIARTEDELQKAVYELQKITQDYNLNISANKQKTMAFMGTQHTKLKIIIKSKTPEQVWSFNF